MMKVKEEIVFTAVLVVIFALFVSLGWGYAKRPRIVPLTLSIPGLVFSMLQLTNAIVKARRASKKQSEAARPESGGVPDGDRKPLLTPEGRKILNIWGWIFALALGINFLGFLAAIPLFLLGFLKTFAGRSWKLSVTIAGSFTLAVYLLFYVGLKTQL
jgi:hypothetical protein